MSLFVCCGQQPLTFPWCRTCPGKWLALDTVWLAIATTLAAFDISKPLDAQGQPIEPDTEYMPTLLRFVLVNYRDRVGFLVNVLHSGPKPFQCAIVPRSDAALALVRQTEESH